MVILMDFSGIGEGSLKHENHAIQRSESVEQMVNATLKSLPFELDSSLVYHIDEFTLSRLAHGFFGEIFKAEHRKTKKTVVVKVEATKNEDCSLMKEIEVLKRISHPNVVRFLGICIKEHQVYLVTEYINGGNLEELLMNHEETLDWSCRVYLARDIASGMAFLHKQRVLHRDLASKNCLIKLANGTKYAIVADLGLATELPESEGWIQNTVGSPYNMAPELLRGEMYNGKADVFSYGIILCEIIGRVQADPEELPRTGAFGLDVEKFSTMVGDCPLEFLHTAICCCQMDPQARPSFVSTIKHLDMILFQYPIRPDMPREPAPESLRQLDAEESNNNLNINSNARLSSGAQLSPAVVPPDGGFRGRSHTDSSRRASWIASRYKLFHTATDDLLKSTPSKLMGFFKNVLGVRSKELSISSRGKKDMKQTNDQPARRRSQSSSVLTKISHLGRSKDTNYLMDRTAAGIGIGASSCPGSPGDNRKHHTLESSLRRHTIAPTITRNATSDLQLNLTIDDTDFPEVSPRSTCSDRVSFASDISSVLGTSSAGETASGSPHSSQSSQPSSSRECDSLSSNEDDDAKQNSTTPTNLICSQIKTPHLDRSGTYSVIDAEASNRDELENARENEKLSALGTTTPTGTKAKRRIRSPLFGFFQIRNRNKSKDSE